MALNKSSVVPLTLNSINMMTNEFDNEVRVFVLKFHKVINLLQSFYEKPKSCFSEDLSFLLDKALDHLKVVDNVNLHAGIGRDEGHTALIKSPVVKQFLSETLKAASTIHLPIVVFSIQLVTELSSNRSRFQKLISESKGVLSKVVDLTGSPIMNNVEIKNSILNLFISLAKFEDGLQWIWSSGILQFITSSLNDKTIFTRKTAQELIGQILLSTNGDQIKEICERLLIPIKLFQTSSTVHQADSDRLEPYFSILESYMEKCLIQNIPNQIGMELLSMNVQDVFINLVQNIQREKLVTKIYSLLVGIYAKCALERLDKQSKWEDETWNVIQLVLRRGLLRATLALTSQSLYFWSHVDGHEDFCLELLQILVIPILIGVDNISDDKFKKDYLALMEYWKNVPQSSRSISDELLSKLQTHPELNEITTVVFTGLGKSVKNLSKENALKLIHSGLFLLRCLSTDEAKRVVQLAATSQLTIHLTNAVCSYIDIHNIGWWEYYETCHFPIGLTKLVLYSVSRDTQITYAVLQGIKFCIKQLIYLDNWKNLPVISKMTNDVTSAILHCSGSLHWEVRDSALEVLVELTKLSAHYPEFQQLLISSNLVKVAISAANDSESYVQASSMAVIASVSGVPLLWQHLNSGSEAINCCFFILQKDREALARRAAAKALVQISQNGHFPLGESRIHLYRTMSSAALSDLDWEVKLHALEFWQFVINETLTSQIMLAGSRAETQIECLKRALSELGLSGCLHVLIQAVNDCDVPVREKSVRLLQEIRTVITNCNGLDLGVWVTRPALDSSIQSDCNVENPAPVTVGADADSVIEDILAVNDISLVAGILTDKQPELRPDPSPVTVVKTEDFISQVVVMELEDMLRLTAVSSDLHVSDLNSLLDDLQDCIHTDHSRPRPDCY